MSYKNDVRINGFDMGIGRIVCLENFKKPPMQIIFDLDDEKIIDAIKNLDVELLKAMKEAYDLSDEFDAINEFHNFEYYFTQGSNNWSRFGSDHSFQQLEEYKRKAMIVLNSKFSNDNLNMEARRFLDFLDGKIPEYIPSPEELLYKKKEKFVKSRSKWLKLLIERDGYECKRCKIKNNLCVKHSISIMNGGETELNNLNLFCRTCINKK